MMENVLLRSPHSVRVMFQSFLKSDSILSLRYLQWVLMLIFLSKWMTTNLSLEFYANVSDFYDHFDGLLLKSSFLHFVLLFLFVFLLAYQLWPSVNS